jgi:hypothetical protein
LNLTNPLSPRGALLRSIEDLDAKIAEFRPNGAVIVSPVLLGRLESLRRAATYLGDAELVGMLERLYCRVTTGRGLDAS